MSKFRFLENTPLRFIRLEDFNQLQTESNRFAKDYDYMGKVYMPFVCEFEQNDPLFFQFRTDYLIDSITINLVNCSTGGTTTATPTLKVTYSDGRKLYNCSISTSGLSGIYYITVSVSQYAKPMLNYRSENFTVVAKSNKLKLEWFGSSTLPDPFIWETAKATLRIEAEVKKKLTGGDKTTYMDTDGNYENTYTLPQSKRLLQIRLVPEWVQTLLDLAIMHDSFYVNGVEYNCESGFEFESTSNTMYPSKLTIIQKNYYNFVSDNELTGSVPTYADVLRTTGLTTRTTGLTDRKINN